MGAVTPRILRWRQTLCALLFCFFLVCAFLLLLLFVTRRWEMEDGRWEMGDGSEVTVVQFRTG